MISTPKKPNPSRNRFFLGKNKLMQKALGTRPEDEIRDNLRHLTKVRWSVCVCVCVLARLVW